jgi:DHA2 family multidrug resistance protein
MLWRTSFATNISFGLMIWPQLAQGLAMPFLFFPLMSLGTGALRADEVAGGAGLINFMRTTAGAFGTSVATTIWTDSAARSHADLSGKINDAASALDGFSAAGMTAAQSLQQLDGLVQGQAVMVATNQTFRGVACVMLIAAASIWIAPRPRGRVKAVNAH